MQPKSIKEVGERVKGFYQKAKDAASQRNHDYAIEMYNTALKHCPEFRAARLELRSVQMDKIKNKVSGMRQTLVGTKNSIAIGVKGPGLIKKEQYNEAMQVAESVLIQDPTVPGALKLLANAAEEADMEWLAIDTLEFMLKHHNKDTTTMRWLIALYLDNGRGEDAVALCHKMQRMNPEDSELQSLLKNAMARQAMDKSAWMEENKAQETSQGAESATASSGMIRRDTGARTQSNAVDLIERYVREIEGGNDSVEIRKKLARAYTKAEQYDAAIEQLDYCIEQKGDQDPSLANMMFKAVDARFEQAINAWQDYGQKGPDEQQQAESEIANLKQHRLEYKLLRAQERAVKYSKDPNVHMELALCLWESERYQEAISQFTQAQGSARHRKQAILKKAKCLSYIGEFADAVEEFKLVIGEMPARNSDKLDATYELGLALKELGRDDEAAEQFSIVQQTDAAFRDIQNLAG